MTRHPAVLVAPLITFVVVIALLIVARSYERLPLRPPACSFRTLTGLPCLGCGGTRAVRALAAGDVLAALRFHPAVLLGCAVAGIWPLWGFWRYRKGNDVSSPIEQNRKLVRAAWIIGVVLVLNWIYLIKFLP
jgi:hypothetical protein